VVVAAVHAGNLPIVPQGRRSERSPHATLTLPARILTVC
jgi:hypothetical protein